MIYEQHIPFYISKFKECSWKIYESEHYIFNVKENSLAEKEIESIKTRQESAYTKITQLLKLQKSKHKIIYYFYSSQEEKAKLMGDGWYGQSIYDEFTIHAIYNEKDKVVGEHEDTHLLSLQLGLPISLFQEGLAEFMVGKSMFLNEHNEVIRKALKSGLLIDMQSLMSQEGWMNTPDEEAEFYYSIAGSFVEYLINTFGIEPFKELYKAMDRKNDKEKNLEIFKKTLGIRFDDLISKWLKNIIF